MGKRCVDVQVEWQDYEVPGQAEPVPVPMAVQCDSDRTAETVVRVETGDTWNPFRYVPLLLCQYHADLLAAELGWGQDALSRPLQGVAVCSLPRPDAFRVDHPGT